MNKEQKMEVITVAIVEDDQGIRETLGRLLEGTPGFRCVGSFATAEEALQRLPLQKPAVVLVDINLPKMSGIELVAALKAEETKMHFLVLTVYEDSAKIFQALAAGASGYLLKRVPPAKLLEAIKEVREGGSPMSSSIARQVVQSFYRMGQGKQESENLSPRELEILQLLTDGYLYKEIAEKLSIGRETVRTYIGRIYEKLHVRTRTEAVVKHLRQ
jgi:DNA-binding NarL/FixJ family response regulator